MNRMLHAVFKQKLLKSTACFTASQASHADKGMARGVALVASAQHVSLGPDPSPNTEVLFANVTTLVYQNTFMPLSHIMFATLLPVVYDSLPAAFQACQSSDVAQSENVATVFKYQSRQPIQPPQRVQVSNITV
jgi:hypothetical protein